MRLPPRIATAGLPELTASVGLALTFWEPIMGPALVAVGFIGQAIRGAFPPATGPTDEMLAKLTEVEGRLGRLELRQRP